MAKHKVKRLEISHIYDFYPLYQVMYGRGMETKAFEVSKFAKMVLDFEASTSTRRKWDVLEPFSGISEHEHFFAATGLNIEHYTGMDIVVPEGATNVIQGDIITTPLPSHVNAVFAFYYSLQNVRDAKTDMHTRAKLVEFFDNVLGHLQVNANKSRMPAVFAFHLDQPEEPNYYLTSRADVGGEQSWIAPACGLLGQHLGCKPTDTLEVKCNLDTWYNRIQCTAYDQAEDIQILVNGRVTATVDIKKPFTHRVWTEHEVIDILRGLDYKLDIRMYNGTLSNYDFVMTRLDDKPVPGDEEANTNQMTTDMLVVVNPR
ncbi:hypothetical protein Peetri_00191 [Pseudomonas phage vB_PpuM-Peetri]